MRLRLALTLLLVAGGLVFVVPGRALACSCSPNPSFERAVQEADAVFVGVVTSSEQTSGQRSFLGSEPYGNFVYTFDVDEVLAGEVGPTIEVGSHSSGASCGIRFQEGARYVVFAYEGRRGLDTYSCSRTERINETVDFGLEAPTGKPVDPDVGASGESKPMDASPSPVLVGAAALLGAAGILTLLRFLLPAGR